MIKIIIKNIVKNTIQISCVQLGSPVCVELLKRIKCTMIKKRQQLPLRVLFRVYCIKTAQWLCTCESRNTFSACWRSYRFPRRFNSCSSVATWRAPVQPTGWPRAMAPPLGFNFSYGIPSFSTQYVAWLANASFSSKMSMSDIPSPATETTLDLIPMTSQTHVHTKLHLIS